MIDRAANHDDFAPLAAQFTLVQRDLGGMLAAGMQGAVICTEDAPYFDMAAVDRAALEATYVGVEVVDELRQACTGWPKGVMADGFKTPVVSDHPVLLLSGEADPVTPPSGAERAAATLRKSRHVVVKGHGHGLARLDCVSRMIGRFVETASVAAIDIGCLKNERPSPFFVSPNGPTP